MPLILRLLCLFSLVSQLSAKQEAVVFVVDPLWDCVASYVAHVPLLLEGVKSGKYKIIKVMTRLEEAWEANTCNSIHTDASLNIQNITYNSWTPDDALATEEICPKLMSLGVPIAAVIPTFDPAVYLADRLATCSGARGNPSEGPLAKARRDKWVTNEAVRKAGLRAVREKVVSTWNEAEEFLASFPHPLSETHPVIFKFLQGSSSEGVQKVTSMKQAEDIISSEVGSESSFGEKIGQLLIQEFLHGKEYVIDSASRDGVHKVQIVWHEDLRNVNGVFDLYFGFKAMDPEEQKTKIIIDYANKVLDVTGFRNGAADMEVIWVEGEATPCVIDLNARWTALMWHDGLALEKEIVGTDQITATITAYLDGDAFDKMLPVPSLKQHGALFFPEIFRTGILRGVPGLAVAKKSASYIGTYEKPDEPAVVGQLIKNPHASHSPMTIILAHKDKATVDADYNRLVGLEMTNTFFDIEPLAGRTSLTAFRQAEGSAPGHKLPAVTALLILAVAAVLALATQTLAALSQRNVQDGTEYLTIE